jgi:signal transduction histidine kinase
MSNGKTTQEPGARTELTGETDEKDTGFKIAEAQILGRSLAFLAHDIQNHLATINESAGWMKDLLEQRDKRGLDRIILYFKRARVPDSEALFPGLETIQKQVSQVSAVTKRLSRFAHCLQEKKSVIDANKVLEEVMDVLLQETREKDIHLELKQTKEVCMIEIDPIGLQMAVFENMKSIIKKLESGARLILETTMQNGEFHVRFTDPNDREHSNPLSKEPDSQDFLRYMVGDLGGRIRHHTGSEKPFNTLVFGLAGG